MGIKRWTAAGLAALLLALAPAGCASPIAQRPDTRRDVQKSPFTAIGTRENLSIAAENDRYALLYNPDTTLIAVWDKAGDTVWHGAAVGEAVGAVNSEETKSEMQSAVILGYYAGNSVRKELFSYGESVAKEQTEVFSIPNGIRIEYTIGEAEPIDLYPKVLTASYVEETLLPAMEEEARDRFLQYFDKYVYEETGEGIRDELALSVKRFPQIPMYYARSIPKKFKKVVKDALIEGGLTKDKLVEEYDTLGYAYTLTPQPSFSVPVEYVLGGDGLQVTVPCGEIAYDTSAFQLTDLRVLPYFGAVGKSSEGYMLVPDGSGALIRLDNGSKNALSVSVFSDDLNEDAENRSTLIKEHTYLPVYGLTTGKNAFFTILEEGNAMASIQAAPYNNVSGLNHIYARYTYQPRQTFDPSGLVAGAEFVRYGNYGYTGDIVQQYRFLHGDEATYSGMAETYRRYLFGGGEARADCGRLYVESYGVLSRAESVIGFETRRDTAYTSLSDLTAILDRLRQAGVDSLALRYKNWAGDPLADAMDTKGKISRLLGGAAEKEALLQKAEELRAPVYWDWETQYAAEIPRSGGLSGSKNAVVSLKNTLVKRYRQSDEEAEGRLMLNAAGIRARFQQIERRGGDTQALSLSGVGNDLYSDFSKERYTLREEMKTVVEQAIAGLAKDRAVAVDGANAYVLPYATVLFDLPTGSSWYGVLDETVPFLQMVLRGYVPYTAASINMSHDAPWQFLKCVEYGAQLKFTLNAGDSRLLKNTAYTAMFSTDAETGAAMAAQMYARYQPYAAAVGNAAMVRHEPLAESAAAVTYANGKTVVVNYGSEPYTYAGTAVPAGDYAVVEARGDAA